MAPRSGWSSQPDPTGDSPVTTAKPLARYSAIWGRARERLCYPRATPPPGTRPLRLMQDRWPQGFVVSLLRRMRPELEKEHALILKQNSALIFDRATIRQRGRPGDMAIETASPVFLAVVSADTDHRCAAFPVAVCRSQEDFMRFLLSQGIGRTVTSFELVTSAQRFSAALAKTEPRDRGRARA